MFRGKGGGTNVSVPNYLLRDSSDSCIIPGVGNDFDQGEGCPDFTNTQVGFEYRQNLNVEGYPFLAKSWRKTICI